MKKLFILLLSLSTFNALAQIRFLQVQDLNDYELVLKSARQSKNLLLVAVHDGGGDFRKMYLDNVFDDAALKQAAKPYTKVAINIADPMGERFAQIFAFKDFPGFYLMNDEEFVLDILEGYQSANQLREALNQASAQTYRYDSLLVKYNQQSLSTSEWIELLELYALNFDYLQTVRLAQEFLNAQNEADLLQAPFAAILSQYGVNLETPYPALIIANSKSLKKQLPDFELSDFLDLAIEYNLDRAIISEDSTMVEQIVKTLVISPLVAKDSLAAARLNIHREFAWQSEKFKLYADALIDYYAPQAPSVAANLLFDEAYDLVEEFNNSSALSAAQKIAAASDQKIPSFRARMLEAYIAYLQKDFDRADAHLQKARPLIKSPEQLRSLEKLQGMLKEEPQK